MFIYLKNSSGFSAKILDIREVIISNLLFCILKQPDLTFRKPILQWHKYFRLFLQFLILLTVPFALFLQNRLMDLIYRAIVPIQACSQYW